MSAHRSRLHFHVTVLCILKKTFGAYHCTPCNFTALAGHLLSLLCYQSKDHTCCPASRKSDWSPERPISFTQHAPTGSELDKPSGVQCCMMAQPLGGGGEREATSHAGGHMYHWTEGDISKKNNPRGRCPPHASSAARCYKPSPGLQGEEKRVRN